MRASREVTVVKPKRGFTPTGGQREFSAGRAVPAKHGRTALDKVFSPPAPQAAARTILQDAARIATAESSTYVIRVSVRNIHKNQFSVFFRVPEGALAEIGDPPRILVEGTPQSGYTLTPQQTVPGVKIDYGANYNGKVHIQTGIGGRGVDKIERGWADLEATVIDGVIVTGPCPPGWMEATGVYHVEKRMPRIPESSMVLAPQQRPQLDSVLAVAEAMGLHTQVMPPGNGHRTHILDGLPLGDTPEEIAALTKRIHHVLGDVRTLKQELERRTGLKFKLTSNLTFTLDV